MTSAAKWIVRLAAYGAFAALVGYLSAAPAYDYASADLATIKVSLSHATEHVKPCVSLTPEQIAALAPNMRHVEQCERQRLPLVVELAMDGVILARIEAPPSGLWGDGPASVYRRFEVQPGNHTLSARLRESHREEGWDYTHTEDVMLEPGRYFTISFHAATGGFVFR